MAQVEFNKADMTHKLGDLYLRHPFNITSTEPIIYMALRSGSGRTILVDLCSGNRFDDAGVSAGQSFEEYILKHGFTRLPQGAKVTLTQT